MIKMKLKQRNERETWAIFRKNFLGCCVFFETSMHRKMEETILGLK